MTTKEGMDEGKTFADAVTEPLVGAELLYPELFKKAGLGFNALNKLARVTSPAGIAITGGGVLKNVITDSEPNLLIDRETGEPKTFEREDASFVMPTMIDMNEQAYKLSKEKGIPYEEAFKQLGEKRTFAEGIESLKEKYAIGGRVGFADGPEDPSKRKFMKIAGGLASLPIIGRFFDIAQVAEKAAPAAVEAIKNAPPHFLGLVNKIRALGKVFPGSKERSEVYRYDDYEMDIDYDTGTIDITKNKEGMFGDEIAPMEQVKMTYSPGVADKTTGGKVADQYDEYTVRPDDEGKMKDVEDGVPDDVIDEGSISKEELEQLIIENMKKGEK
jgi:hypothetical protein